MSEDFFNEMLDKLDENKSHCCECVRGILHHVCTHLCKNKEPKKCSYSWTGKEYIVVRYDHNTDEAISKEMTFYEWKKWIAIGAKPISLIQMLKEKRKKKL